jgi:hypothetical protein
VVVSRLSESPVQPASSNIKTIKADGILFKHAPPENNGTRLFVHIVKLRQGFVHITKILLRLLIIR